MSVSFLAVPVADSFLEYGRTSGYQLPSNVGLGCWPSLGQLRQCLVSIPDHEMTVQGDESSFSITSESLQRVPLEECEFDTANTDTPETHLEVRGHLKGKPSPLISFHGDYDLMVSVVQQLTECCGPQCFFADYEGVPYFVIDPSCEPIGPSE